VQQTSEGLEAVVRLEAVTKTYPGNPQPALEPLSLEIGRGEFFSILGPSGSGKTTTLRLIAGFERPESGRVFIDGADATALPPYKRNVNTVFQSYALFPHMNVAENVAYPLRMAGMERTERRKKSDAALELVQMTGFGARYPHQLSGGQRQRIALARAIVGSPKVLLLDEPLGALDLRLRQEMQHALVGLQRDLGITFVYVTHDQGEALSMSHRVAVMDKGVVRQLGAPQELYFAPRDEFVARFIGKSNILACEVSGSIAKVLGLDIPLSGAARSGKARFCLRFESVQLLRDEEVRQGPSALGADGLVRLPGQVTDVLFLGNAQEVKVRCGGTELIAHAGARRDDGYRSGQPVVVALDPRDAVLFHD
jgi:spermidine/putrescine transport system ATP-binding protein